MRLTVHVTDAQKETVIKKTANGEKKITRLMTTLSFDNVEERDLQSILNSIQESKQGTPVKYYFSGQKILGQAKVRKKKQQ